MKLELQKIEATLHQLMSKRSHNGEQPMSGLAEQKKELQSPPTAATRRDPPTPTPRRGESVPMAQGQGKKTPALPNIKQPRFTSHRNGANPYLAMSLLKEMEAIVERWQTELRQILRQIQDIYLEGPIVEGWLESDYTANPHQTYPANGVTKQSIQGESSLVEKRETISEVSVSQVPNSQIQPGVKTAGYRLVGWDADGKLWSRPCPPSELPSVSLAIARYQKLQNMLVRKQELETHLMELAEVLTVVQGHIQTL